MFPNVFHVAWKEKGQSLFHSRSIYFLISSWKLLQFTKENRIQALQNNIYSYYQGTSFFVIIKTNHNNTYNFHTIKWNYCWSLLPNWVELPFQNVFLSRGVSVPSSCLRVWILLPNDLDVICCPVLTEFWLAWDAPSPVNGFWSAQFN